MTGFGRSEANGDGVRFAVEIRSVNNRYLDIQVKLPRDITVMETRVKKAVQQLFSRGRFDIFITRNDDHDGVEKLAFNDVLAGQYVAILRDLKARYELGGEIDVSLIAGMQDIISVREIAIDPELTWHVLEEGLTRALHDLDRMRTEEGAALVKDMLTRLDSIDRLTASIRVQSPVSVENARKRMSETLQKILNDQPDPVRLAQEIALLAERTDVTEELIRLASHMTQYRTMLADVANDSVGRRLDFLLQEMGREANTIASKAMDAAISFDVVNVKAELEKIREQAQNIE